MLYLLRERSDQVGGHLRKLKGRGIPPTCLALSLSLSLSLSYSLSLSLFSRLAVPQQCTAESERDRGSRAREVFGSGSREVSYLRSPISLPRLGYQNGQIHRFTDGLSRVEKALKRTPLPQVVGRAIHSREGISSST